jgi:hypothetical protein
VPTEPRPSSQRIDLARALLREFVFQSRAKQAAGTSLSSAADSAELRNCGLGAHAAIEANLSEAGRALAAQLWPTELAADARVRVNEVISGWVERQDALDRKRNHFLRDFRGANGFDRKLYTSEQLAAFEAGLERINHDEDRQRDEAAALL